MNFSGFMSRWRFEILFAFVAALAVLAIALGGCGNGNKGGGGAAKKRPAFCLVIANVDTVPWKAVAYTIDPDPKLGGAWYQPPVVKKVFEGTIAPGKEEIVWLMSAPSRIFVRQGDPNFPAGWVDHTRAKPLDYKLSARIELGP